MFVLLGGGAEERVRPGWAKGSGEDSLPQILPMVVDWGGNGGMGARMQLGVGG